LFFSGINNTFDILWLRCHLLRNARLTKCNAGIIDFPNVDKVYTNEVLWPFFAARIPSINQPYQVKKIEKAKINRNDPVALLKLFGLETITNLGLLYFFTLVLHYSSLMSVLAISSRSFDATFTLSAYFFHWLIVPLISEIISDAFLFFID
jgi:hypothetical protein